MLNYIGVFLTFKCRMGCDYCLNRQGDFDPKRKNIDPYEWVKILKDIPTREDLPISLQGGEPTLYKGFYTLVNELHCEGKKMDLLTNGDFDLSEFLALTTPEMFRRKAPYASIRFSLHKNTNDVKLVAKVLILHKKGYSVGIWGLSHPDMAKRNRIVQKVCADRGLDYREKEYLDEKHGTYKYPLGVSGVRQGRVSCHVGSELLFAPDGRTYPCHHYLYAGTKRDFKIAPDGGIICDDFGLCSSCDVKEKTNRLQQKGYCAVEIKEIVK